MALNHINVSAGTLFRTFFASYAEFEFELIRIGFDRRFYDSIILTEHPASFAGETLAAAHAPFRLGT